MQLASREFKPDKISEINVTIDKLMRRRDFTVSAHITRSQSRVQTKELMDEGKHQRFKSIL
ncbi:hypothetical protein P5673_030331 [Acropora cervicornis]|uniref:Uncharacterized protein n=1 Tax=Acropora cervicornis TaxID=6130 RepID=A0AAD9PUC5_ACRCE|nr:hypothetical protein P5673_030331 [Acropora cervicornis]